MHIDAEAADGAVMSTTMSLAKFIAETRPEEIPDDVLRHGKRCVINMLAVALHATQNPAIEMRARTRC